MREAGHDAAEPDPAIAGLNRRVALVRLLLLWEAVWRAGFVALSAIGFFAALSLFDIWRWLPDWLHLLALMTLTGACCWSLARRGRGIRLAGRQAVLARIEADNALAHHPLQTLEDRPAVSDLADAVTETEALWRIHLDRARQAVARLGWRMARPNLLASDPNGVRLMAGIAVAAGLFVSGTDAPQLLREGFWPFVPGVLHNQTRIEAWITPPAYTDAAPLFLSGAAQAGLDAATQSASGAGEALRVPVGSELFVRLFSTGGAAELLLTPDREAPAAARQRIALAKVDSANQAGQVTLRHGGGVALRQSGRTLRQWRVLIRPDLPPAIQLADKPMAGPRGGIRLVFDITDDYGVAEAHAELAPIGVAQPGEPLRLALPLPAQSSKKGRQIALLDLTEHDWAGSPVRLSLVATDAAKQQGRSGQAEFILPRRAFHNPLALALIEQRAILSAPAKNFTPVVMALDALTRYPERYIEDQVVYIGMRAARHRLAIMRDMDTARGEVRQLLWKLALRLEDGNVSLVADELNELQNRLAEALRDGASEDEIAALTQQLREALDRYLQAMAEQMIEGLDDGDQNFAPGGQSKQIGEGDLQRMLDQIEQLGKSGARAAARDLLSQLQDLLQSMRPGTGEAGQSPQQQAYRKALEGLAGTMRQQQQLRDETFRQRQNGPGESGGSESGGTPGAEAGLPGRQGALRRALGQVMQELRDGQGNVPGALGDAEKAMGEAAEALAQGLHGDAIKDQGESLDALRSGAEAVAKAMREQAGGEKEGDAASAEDEDAEDPLGRRMPGSGQGSGNSLAIPEQFDIERALEIRRELERRAGDRRRPVLELDYIDRLLKLF